LGGDLPLPLGEAGCFDVSGNLSLMEPAGRGARGSFFFGGGGGVAGLSLGFD